MEESKVEAYLTEVDRYLRALHKRLDMDLSVLSLDVPLPPRLEDFR